MTQADVMSRAGHEYAKRKAGAIACRFLRVKDLCWNDRTRAGPECEARQLAVYLLVAGLGIERQTVAGLVERHHSTVEHAVRTIETRRDDPDFDAEMTRLELELRVAVAAEDIAGA